METPHFLSGSQLKWIAIFAMLLDHTAKIISFQPSLAMSLPFTSEPDPLAESLQAIFPVFILIGRLAFPIFCFLLVEGFLHTSNTKRYLVRLALFALISEVPYDLAFSHQLIDLRSQNVFFTLLIGLIVIIGLKKLATRSMATTILSLGLIGTGIFLAEWLHTDYGGWIGVLLIVVLYLFRDFRLLKCLLGAIILLQNSLFGPIAFFLIYFYNGKRGKQWKYFFYWFYPVHLFVLTSIQQFLIMPYFN
ncbi:hypothetical protein A5821_000135 [Enterococcus sp. 7F3_DIV0205]|uniref:TraX family protein n=1 Tax=Candidatus Enterococcus palustris TaxID=1834189 RepID=A0AAQ3Y3Q2_9ENTE|nr:TraX family protein [Enterococcus sp. 7F3_DIV0205]OTN84541.1 hypothetical protein A5821_000469 [Enterococcus sp. 7F3_DIV0205]